LVFTADNDALPNYAVVKPWSTANIPITGTSSTDPTSSTDTTFTISEIADAALRVKNYVETNKCLPDTVEVGGVSVNIAQYLYLACQATVQISSGDLADIVLESESVPAGFCEEMSSGQIVTGDYLDLAERIIGFMDENHQAPLYGLNGLGKISYQSLTYMYTRILVFTADNDALPNYAVVKPWSTANIPITGTSSTDTTFTISEIADAALRVKNYVETNKCLPNYVQMGEDQLNMAQFLYLAAKATLQLNSGNTASISLKNEAVPTSSYEELSSGNLLRADYVDFAQRIVSFMDANNKAPEYGLVGLGKISYQSQVYLFARVVNFYGANGVLPNYATMKPWTTVTGSTDSTLPSGMEQYLQATANCQSDDPTIIAMAQSITSGATSSYEKAQRIFNWVRDNLNYSFYYNTQKGAVNTLSSRSANCCDHSHLLVALSRAVGLPARYVHGVCNFSSGTYGHVWAQIYVNGQWYNADAISYKNDLGVIRNWDTSSWTYKGTYAELPF